MSEMQTILAGITCHTRTATAASYQGATIRERHENKRTYSVELYMTADGQTVVTLIERAPWVSNHHPEALASFRAETPEAAARELLRLIETVGI